MSDEVLTEPVTEASETAETPAEKPLRMRDLATRTDMFSVDPRIILIEKGHNARNYKLKENRDHLDELKRSIASEGVISPLRLRKDGNQIILVDGECRLRACLELIAEHDKNSETGAEILSVPAILTKGNEQQRALEMITANMGKPLSKWEIGAWLKKFEKWGWDIETMCKRLGYTERFVKEALELADAPVEIKEQLSAQAITPSLAITTMRRVGPTKAVSEIAEKVKMARAAGKTGPVKAKKTASKKSARASASESTDRLWKTCENILAQAYKEGIFGLIKPGMLVKSAELEYPYCNVDTKLLCKLRDVIEGLK